MGSYRHVCVHLYVVLLHLVSTWLIHCANEITLCVRIAWRNYANAPGTHASPSAVSFGKASTHGLKRRAGIAIATGVAIAAASFASKASKQVIHCVEPWYMFVHEPICTTASTHCSCLNTANL